MNKRLISSIVLGTMLLTGMKYTVAETNPYNNEIIEYQEINPIKTMYGNYTKYLDIDIEDFNENSKEYDLIKLVYSKYQILTKNIGKSILEYEEIFGKEPNKEDSKYYLVYPNKTIFSELEYLADKADYNNKKETLEKQINLDYIELIKIHDLLLDIKNNKVDYDELYEIVFNPVNNIIPLDENYFKNKGYRKLEGSEYKAYCKEHDVPYGDSEKLRDNKNVKHDIEIWEGYEIINGVKIKLGICFDNTNINKIGTRENYILASQEFIKEISKIPGEILERMYNTKSLYCFKIIESPYCDNFQTKKSNNETDYHCGAYYGYQGLVTINYLGDTPSVIEYGKNAILHELGHCFDRTLSRESGVKEHNYSALDSNNKYDPLHSRFKFSCDNMKRFYKLVGNESFDDSSYINAKEKKNKDNVNTALAEHFANVFRYYIQSPDLVLKNDPDTYYFIDNLVNKETRKTK